MPITLTIGPPWGMSSRNPASTKHKLTHTFRTSCEVAFGTLAALRMIKPKNAQNRMLS